MRSVKGPYVLSPFVLAEMDYLLATRVGAAAQKALLEDVGAGRFRLELFASSDVERALNLMKRFADLDIGLADASVVVLAERHAVREVLTLDERHFRALRGFDGKPFRLIPADATPA